MKKILLYSPLLLLKKGCPWKGPEGPQPSLLVEAMPPPKTGAQGIRTNKKSNVA